MLSSDGPVDIQEKESSSKENPRNEGEEELIPVKGPIPQYDRPSTSYKH